ncbi:RNA polymerase sigma-70 factor [Streptomyces sp. P38-E01]|uniref:RNA polymerase sigma-70 factor n=2 Tax=Streptomyces tardus TaxID=2780544 RepID=A0A949N5G8_9ACTN|nr:RNA polymerase sigma-70 factor [Streptomyces tardus]MBU7597982.1 RNA polymerase sigma-70 factor [Streptomyces tardus]
MTDRGAVPGPTPPPRSNRDAGDRAADHREADDRTTDDRVPDDPAGPAPAADDPFVTHRGLLFTVAYEMLGSAADAEDVVQESWLRWAGADREQVREPRAYLVRIVTRQALNRMRTVARRREEYIGQWLPEPLLTTPDVAEDVELAESVSMAMLTVLETLQPVERAVFVLREVFAVSHEEIAAALDKTTAATRQIARRARTHVEARRPRVRVSAAEREQVSERFLAAVRGGDLDTLLELLAPDVVFVGDGGGFVKAALRPVAGAEKVARLLAAGHRHVAIDGRTVPVNGGPGLWIEADGRFAALGSLEIVDGLITRIYAVNNPHKLTRMSEPTRFER